MTDRALLAHKQSISSDKIKEIHLVSFKVYFETVKKV